MRATPLALALALLTLIAAVPGHAQETPRMGGVLKVAAIGEPPTLDIAMSTATQVYEIMWHASESLFTYDRNFSPIPMLAESYTVGDKGLRYTITLRRRSEEHTSELQSLAYLVCRLLLETTPTG